MRQAPLVLALALAMTGGLYSAEQAPAGVEPAAQVPAAADPGAEQAMAAVIAAPAKPGPLESYTPPPCEGLFPDVPCTSGFAPWIEQLFRDQITAGCGGGLYCPESSVTRAQMAVFLEKMARGTNTWPPNVVTVYEVVNQYGVPDVIASGQALLDAISAIPGTGPQAPTPENPTVVSLGPGKYALEGARLELPGYVHLHGAGRYITKIESYADSPEAVRLTGFAEIRDLTISVTAAVGPAIGIVVEAGGGLRLLDAELNANAASTVGTGLATQSSIVTVERTRISGVLYGGSGFAVYVSGTGSDTIAINDSSLWGSSHAVYHNSEGIVELNNTGIASGALYKGPSASYRCRLTYNNLFGTVSCP